MNGDPNEFRRQQRGLVRAHARTSLYGFYRLVFPALAPEASFSSSPHFRVLARALEEVGTGDLPERDENGCSFRSRSGSDFDLRQRTTAVRSRIKMGSLSRTETRSSRAESSIVKC